MKEYNLTFYFTKKIDVTVEAESLKDALEEAQEELFTNEDLYEQDVESEDRWEIYCEEFPGKIVYYSNK